MTVVLVVIAAAARRGRRPARGAWRSRRRPARPRRGPAARRILFPFVGARCRSPRWTPRCASPAPRTPRSCRSTWPLCRCTLPLDAALPREARSPAAARGRRAARAPRASVDTRIERGRTYRHALLELIAHERYDQIVVAAAPEGAPGFTAADVAWLLDQAPGEIMVLRPSDEAPGRRPLAAAAA